jgi:alpha-mannosidase
MGWKLYWAFGEQDGAEAQDIPFDKKNFENEYLRVNIDKNGFVESVFDKINNRMLCGRILPIVIDETDCDTWAHYKFNFNNICGEFGGARILSFEAGTVRSQLRIAYTYNSSEIILDINLYNGLPAVYINCKVRWNEKHKVLKLVFPTDLDSPKEVAAVPFGFSKRFADGKEQPMQKWVALKCDEYGLGLATDTRAAYDIKDNALRITALRSPAYADHMGNRDSNMDYTEQGEQNFKLALTPVKNDFTELYKLAENLLAPPVALLGTYHKGSLGAEGSMVQIDCENIIVTAFKPAENREGYVLRCHEITGDYAKAKLSIPLLGIEFSAEFSPQQIKTFRINDGKITETNFLEE